MDFDIETSNLAQLGELLSTQIIEATAVCGLALEADHMGLFAKYFQRLLSLQEELRGVRDLLLDDVLEASHTMH